MKNLYSLDNVTLYRVATVRPIVKPLCCLSDRQMNEREFALQAEGVGSFYACDGKRVEYSVADGADPDWVRLYLNGQVLVALLHQRKIINFHASSFIHNGKGIMILGETGAGKSSLTASFTLNGAGFLSDDLTAVTFRESKPSILPLYKEIKIRENTVEQLKISRARLTGAEAGTGKNYLNVEQAGVKDYPLNTIIMIGIGATTTPEFYIPEPAERFSLLRSEICSWEILAGMPDTEADYLSQLLQIVHRTKFVRVVRPAEIEIKRLKGAIERYLEA